MRTELLLLTTLACAAESPECPDCPACPQAAAPAAPDGELRLSAWEADLLRNQIQDLRSGIRPYGDRGFGVCTGTTKCGDFLGAAPGVLAPGSYLVRAELAVPQLGDGWRVRITRTCDDGSTPYKNEFSVRYAGTDRGYRLEPLFRVEVREGAAARACTAALTPIRPDGVEAEAFTASWSSGAG